MTEGAFPQRDLCARTADWITSVKVEDPAVRAKAKVLLVDALTLGVAARQSNSQLALASLGPGAVGRATMWADGTTCHPHDAILRNALLVHDRFQDDCELMSWTHPGSFVVPVAVASAEHAGATYAEMLDAIAVGYAVVSWLGADEEVALQLMRRGFRCSPVMGPFAAAAAFARASAMSQEGVAAALSMSSLLGRGTLQAVAGGGDDWRWQVATAARDGALAASVAQAGVKGAALALEGPNGFLAAYCGGNATPGRWSDPPQLSSIHAVWHKHFPALGDNMAAAIAASIAREQLAGRRVHEIASARLQMPSKFFDFPGTQRLPPYTSPTEALASVKFTIAVALINGAVQLEHFQDFANDEVTSLAKRIEVQPSDDLSYTTAALRVELSDGTEVAVNEDTIPQTLFFRDEKAAIDAAVRLLGNQGRLMANSILHADDNVPATKVMDGIFR